MAIYYTYARNLTGDTDQKPNALLFSSDEPISDAKLEEIFKDQNARALFSKNPDARLKEIFKGQPSAALFDTTRPVMAVRYSRPYDDKNGWFPEHRVILTTLSYFNMPVNEDHAAGGRDVSVMWDELDAAGQPIHRMVRFQSMLENCIELYRTMGCEDCPKKGRECIEQQTGQAFGVAPYRPWPFLYSNNRTDPWSKSLAADGNTLDRQTHNDEHEFDVPSLKDLDKKLSKLVIAGATFRKPAETGTGEDMPLMQFPLRQCRHHRFFKDPAFAPKAAGEAATES